MYEFLGYQVRHVMTTDVVSIRRDTPVGEIEDLFDAHDFNALPVLDEAGALEGLVTKLDVLRAFAFTPESIVPPYEEIRRRPAEAVMTREPISVAPRLPLTRALHKLIETRNKSFPVVEGERLAGMLAREDVIRALRRAAAGERAPAET